MINKIFFFSILFLLSANLAMAQMDQHTMTDKQKAQAAKADAYLINSKKKIADSLTAKRKDSTVATEKLKKKKSQKSR
jgi:hypothetical protein